MSIFSRLLRDSSSPNTLSDREKRLRRRRFLKGLEDHSRSMRMEQLEPRLLLTGDFFAADEWAIIKEGSNATTAEDLPSGSLDDGVYYLGVAPEDGPLDPAEAPIKVIATGAGYIGRAGGTEPLRFMDVKTYIKNKMEWELLFCGHFDLEEDETFTSQLTVLSCPGGLDTLEIAGLAFEPSGIGFNQPGGEGRTQSALLQGDLSVDVGAAILGGLQAFDGVRFGGVDQDYWDGITQLQFSVDENNYIKSNKDYGIFVSGTLENVIEQDKQVKITTPWGPRIEIEDLAVSIDTTEMALKVQGEVEVEELPFLNEIRADLTGDNYISLNFAPGTPIEDRINIIGELTFDSTPAKGFDVVYGLNVNTIDGEWGASVDIDTKKIGQFKGEATFDGLELTDFRVEADPKRNIPVVAPYLYLDSGYIDVSDWNQTSTTYEVGTTFNIGPGLEVKLPKWASSMFGVEELKGALGQLDLSGTWQPSTNSFGATADIKVLPVDTDDAEYSLVKQSGTFGGTWPHSLYVSGAVDIPAKEVAGVAEDIAIISGSMAARIQGSRSGYNLYVSGNGSVSLDPLIGQLDDGHIKSVLQDYVGGPALDGEGTIEYVSSEGQKYIQAKISIDMPLATLEVNWKRDLITDETIDKITYGWFSVSGSGESAEGSGGSGATSGEFLIDSDPDQAQFIVTWQQPGDDTAVVVNPDDWLSLTPGSGSPISAYVVDYGSPQHLLEYPGADDDLATKGDNYSDWGVVVEVSKDIVSLDSLGSDEWIIAVNELLDPVGASDYAFQIGLPYPVEDPLSISQVNSAGDGSFSFDYTVTGDSDNDFDFNVVLRNSVDSSIEYSVQHDELIVPYASASVSADATNHIPAGDYQVVVRITDANNSNPEYASQLFEAVGLSFNEVSIPDHLPVFATYLDSYPDHQGAIEIGYDADETEYVPVFAYDVDGDAITSMSISGNSDFVEFDSVTSTLTIAPNPLALGPYTEEFTVSATSVSGTTTQEYQITITPDFSPSDLLVGLNKIGSTINNYVSELNLPDDIPFVSDVVEKTVDYTQVFSDFAAQLVDDPEVTIPVSSSGGNVTFSNERFLLSINGEVPSLITLPDATFAEADVADAFNQSLITAGIDDLVQAVFDDGGTGDILIKPSMPATLQTLELSSSFVDLSMIFNPDFETTGGGDWVGLVDDVPVSFLLNDGLATEREYSIHLNSDGGETDFGTADNDPAKLSDLISDINGLLDLESAPRNLINVAAIQDWDDEDEVQRLIAYGGLSGEGFSATVSSLEVDVDGDVVTSTDLTSPIAVSSAISSYTLKFNTVDQLDSLLQDLTADFDWLDVGLAFDVNEFDPNKQALELNVNIQKELTAEIPFSYDEPIDLGFGNLEIVGEAIASANLIAGFNATIGFDITRGGMAMPISATTELGFLHQQQGVRIDAPVIAENPFNYMDAKNGFGFDLTIHGNYDDPAGTPLQSAISISAAHLASANSEVEALAMIGELLDAHLQDTGYEGAIDVLLTEDGRFALRNNSWMITKLEVSGAVNITHLGFSDNLARESNATDLIIGIDTEPATTLEVVLDGVRTLGDVIDRIEAADVDELIDVSIDPYQGLEIFSGDGFEVIAVSSEFPSIESMVDGDSEYDSSEAALTSTVVQLGLVGEGQLLESGFFLLEGTSLDSRNISQRVYFTEGTDAEPTLYIEEGSVEFEADLIAALGPLGASLHADGKVSLSASLSLEDPGLELPDGKLYLSELADASMRNVVGDPEFDFWVGQYGLADDCGGTVIPGHDHEPATINANITVGGEVVAEANVWMSTDCGIAIGDPGWFVVTTDLSSFEMKDLTIDQIIFAIQQGVDYLKDQDWDWLHQDLPLVNRSAADGLEFLDMVIDKVNGWIYELDLENLGLEFGEFRSFVFNLPNTDTEVSIPGLPDLDFDLEGLIKGKINKGIDFLEQALTLDEDRRLPRLVASVGYLQSLFDGWNIRFDTLGNMEIDIDFDGSGLKTLSYDHTSSITAMFQDMTLKFDAIKLLIPSIENLIESLGPKVSLEVCEALLDSESCEIDNPFKIEFKFGDLDGDEANDAILIGMRYDPEGPILHERFTPHFDVADYGPVEIDIDGDALFTLDGFVQLSVGVGKEPGEEPEFFLITDGNAPIAPTSVQLSTSVTGDLNADIGFGALTAMEGTIGLAIAEAKRVQIDAVDPATHSASLILDEDLHSKSEYLFVYNADGNLISSDEYEVDAVANTITFANSGVYSSQPLEVFYNLTSFDNPQPINVGVSITESSYSEALSPQPAEGLNAKLHLIAVSTNKAVPRSDYELVDGGGQIKIKATESGIELVDSDGFYVYEQLSPIVEIPPVTGDGPTTLLEVPLYGTNKNLNGAEEEQFTVIDETSGEPVDFSLSYDGVDYQVYIPAGQGAGSYQISYPTRETFFDGQGPATVYFDLNNPDTDPATINALGGVKFTDLSDVQINLVSNVLAIAAVDAEILGSSENDVAYAAGMMVGESGELADTEFEFRAGIDAEALNNMLSNIDFNLKTIIEGLEAFLELLETGMRDETLAKLPFIDPEDLTGPADFVRGLREGFVTPLKERLCKAGGQPLSVLEGELAGWVFSALGPGMTSDSSGFESLFADLASELESEPDWLIQGGLNLIDMSQFRFSNTQEASVGDVENLPQISKDKGLAFQDLKNHLAAINAADTYVYKKLGEDWLEIPIAKEDHYSFFKAIVPITFGEEGDKFEIGDIGNLDGATLVGGGTSRIGNIPLGMTYNETVEFKNSLDSLPFEIQGNPSLEFGLHLGFDLGVGVDKSSGFYFITNDEDSAAHQGKELEIGFEAALGEDSSMGIDLFGLMLQAENDGTELSASIGIDISDINTDDHLSLSEIGSNEFLDWFRPEIEFEAELGLVFSAGINSNIPSISTRLGADLSFEIYLDTSNQFQTDFSAGKFGFTDVQLDLGDFLTKTIGPILKEVDKVLDPVKPIVDFLTMEVPGISDASEFAGKGKVMVMDLAFSKDPEMGEKARKFVGVVQQIMDVVEMLASFEEGESMAIEFGSFEFDQASNPTVDMLNEPFPADLENTLDLSNVESAENVTEQANNGSNATVSAGFAKVDEDPGPLGLAGLGIQLDIIKDPMNIVKLLMGQTANLVSWDIPRFDLNFEYTKSFPIWATPPISLGIGADFGLFADFSVGMDTRFRQTGNFLDGFYFGDLEGVHTGADVAELGITIGARLRAALDLLIVSAGVEGELRADIEANWADTNNDGKMYLDEMANIIRQDGFGCLFEISGQLRALISIFYEVDVWFWSASGSKTLADILLYEFELEHCPKWNLAHVAENGEVEFETPGGDVLTSGTDWLIIHAGQFGDMRGGSSSDTHEYFELKGSETELTIEFNHGDVIQTMTTELDGIKTIYFDGGYGSDTLLLTGENWGDIENILFDGGDSNDKLEIGSAAPLSGIALGGSGNDHLLVSAGTVAWELWGEAGDDKIFGSSIAANAVFGGTGNDEIETGSESDFVDGGAGFDVITTLGGKDYVYGGAGDDQIMAGADEDQINAGPGSDTVYGGSGADIIYGAAGNDSLYGEDNADKIFGGSGNDYLDGAGDNDEIAGQDGDDILLGNDDEDTLAGGAGNDFLIGHDGADKLYGGFGDDVLIAHLLGDVDSPASHELYGGPDDDYFCGSHGDDAIFGGTLINEDTTSVTGAGALSLDPVIGEYGDLPSIAPESFFLNVTIPAKDGINNWHSSYSKQEFLILPADLENPPADIGGKLEKPICHVVQVGDHPVVAVTPELVIPVTTTSLTGFVYLDSNEDQQRGDDESGIAEVVVQLQDREGEIVLETVSGEDGSYGFDNVDQGEYTIVQILDASGVYLQISPPNEQSDENVYDVTVSADDQDFGSLDFGNALEGVKIEGRKLRIDSYSRYEVETTWFQQMVETKRNREVADFVPELALMSDVSPFPRFETLGSEGINDWEIYLYDTDWNLLDSTHTSSVERNNKEGIQPEELGWYEFDHLPYGQYIVSEQYRPGWAQVAPPLYFDNAITPIKDDGYSWTNSYAQVGQLPYEYTAIELEMNVHHDNVGELHMWLETPGDGVTPGVRVPLTWTSQRDIQDRRTAEYRGYGFGVAQGDLLDLEDLGSTKFISRSDADDIELAGALGVTEVSSSELSSPVDPFDLSPTTAIASKYKLDVPIDLKNPLDVAGQWRLIIEDVDQGNAGELLDWTLHFYGGENEKTSYPGGVNRNPIQAAGVRTSYVVDMSAPEEAMMMPDGVDEEMSISLDTPSRSYYHFANYELVGDISGTKWHDADGDGKQGGNEQGVSGVKIYLDQNGNGQWDYTDSNLNGQWDANLDENHEPFVYTDAEGNYTFVNVPIGEHTVREDTTDYWQTYPHLLYSENFEGEINKQFDATWNSDTAAKDTLHPHLAPSGVTSFLGDFENDKVELRLNDLPKHQNLRVGFDVYVLGSWDGNHQHQGGDQFRFSANGSPYLVDTSFSNHGAVVDGDDSTISWQNTDNPLDVEVTTTPGTVTEKDTQILFDYVVKHGAVDLSIADSNAITSQGYLDVTGDGFISPRDIISVFNFVNAAAEAEEDNASKDESILGFTQSFGLDETQQPILLASEQQFAPRTGAARAIDFGNHSTDRPLPLEILPGVPAHNTLGYDMYGRNAQQTDQFLPADTTYHFEIEINHDASDLVLEFEALGLTNDGKTNFEKWGIDNIRVLMDHHVVTVQPDQVVTNVDFGNQELPDYSVSGTKYLKVRETQDPLSGVTIYADLNNNDQWDEGEPKDVTRADDPEVPGNEEGTYHLTGIRQAPVTIREMPYGAMGPLLPFGGEHFVTFEKGPHAQGYDFLNARFGSVSGLKWNDANADGKYTAGEEFLEGVNIGLDLDSDGSIDEVTQTDSTGHYLFHYVRPGDHQVVEYVPSGWEPTLPADGKISFSNEIGENVSNLNFGNQRIQVVTGTKYIPGEQGGKDNHVGAAGFTIYADLNDNQNLDQGEPSTQTLHDNPLTDQNEAGFYQLSGFGDRTSVVIRELEKSDWLLVSPEGGRHIVDLSDGSDKTAIDFYNVPTGIVSGFKWHDLDSDGVWTAKEPAIKDWQITIDVNGDDKVDFITITDSNGYYEARVPAGTVTIGEILPSPWRQTYPAENGKHTVHVNHGMHLKDLNFGNVNPEQQGEGDGKVKVFTGALFHDANENGKLDSIGDFPINSWIVYADLNKNEQLDNGDVQVKSNESGNFTIELDTGDVTELGIRVAAPQGWIISSPATGGYLLNVSENDQFSELNFLSVEGATISGHKWSDADFDGRWDSAEVPLKNWEIRLDIDADSGGGYDLATFTNETGYYQFINLPAGTHRVFEVQQEGWHQTAPESISHTVSISPGENHGDLDFGNFQQVVITGKKTDKTTGNGVAGVTIYADLNSDGDLDPGEPVAVTAHDVPATTSIDETGDYMLYVMRHDSLKILEIVPAGWTPVDPSTGYHDLNTSTVSRIDNVDFVNVQDSGSISGSKWNDLDGDGVWDENEPALSSWTIQLDIGQNGTVDQTVVTNSEGNYTFTGLDAGRYQVS
ncbi:MAG: hypothetical protein HOB20_17470, partial [Planctomycetaceae bacterium]|nr:hypothetical protein [Planctomycetaceae bacterium]